MLQCEEENDVFYSDLFQIFNELEPEREIDLYQKTEKLTQKEFFQRNPEAKRRYAVEASRKSREKKRQKKIELIEKNIWLESEHNKLKRRIEYLKKDVILLQDKNSSLDELIQNSILKEEVKRSRKLVGRICDIMKEMKHEQKQNNYTSSTDEDTAFLNKMSAIATTWVKKSVLTLCYESMQNKLNEWKIIYDGPPNMRLLGVSKYFSRISRISIKIKIVFSNNNGKVTPTKAIVRKDIYGISLPPNILTRSLWRFCSRDDEHSAFRKFVECHRKSQGLFQLNIRRLKLKLSALTIENTISKITPKHIVNALTWKTSSSSTNENVDAKVEDRIIFSVGAVEAVNQLAFDYPALNTYDSEEVSMVALCIIPENMSRSSNLDTDKLVRSECRIIHNFEKAKDTSNLTCISEINDPLILHIILKNYTKNRHKYPIKKFEQILRNDPFALESIHGITRCANEILTS